MREAQLLHANLITTLNTESNSLVTLQARQPDGSCMDLPKY